MFTLLTIQQARQLLNNIVSEKNLRRLVYAGHIKGIKVGRKWMIDPDSLDDFWQRVLHPPIEFTDKDGQRILIVK